MLLNGPRRIKLQRSPNIQELSYPDSQHLLLDSKRSLFQGWQRGQNAFAASSDLCFPFVRLPLSPNTSFPLRIQIFCLKKPLTNKKIASKKELDIIHKNSSHINQNTCDKVVASSQDFPVKSFIKSTGRCEVFNLHNTKETLAEIKVIYPIKVLHRLNMRGGFK